MKGGERQIWGEKDKSVAAVVRARVFGSTVVNQSLVSKESIRSTCQQFVLTAIP